jgi:hypothetical protein
MPLTIKNFDVYVPFDDLGNEFLSPSVFFISMPNHAIVTIFNYNFPIIDVFLNFEFLN